MSDPFISERHRGRRLSVLVALAALVVAAAVVAYIVLSNRTGDVHRGDKVEFQPKPPPKPDRNTDWPFYHRDLAHRGYLPASLRPPFRRLWMVTGKSLLEFPPIVVGRTLYFLRYNGGVYAVDSHTGRRRWSRKLGSLSAASPGYAEGRVFVPSLSGKFVCLRASDGKILWQRELPSRTESSPIVRNGVVYFGSEDGTLYAVFARTGRTKWTFHAGGALKASPALVGGTLYVGDYSGRMHAVWARTGRERWSSGTSGRAFGFSSGQFYSTPAVEFGRVYAGNTDSKIYSFSAKSGELAWSKSTGGYVYSSPAVANVEGSGPTVFIGSYDGNLYALDARTGSVRWTARGGGRISGGPTVIGHIVYFADLDSNRTYGVGTGTGKRRVTLKRGVYNPIVSDGERIYLTGHSSITALVPRNQAGTP